MIRRVCVAIALTLGAVACGAAAERKSAEAPKAEAAPAETAPAAYPAQPAAPADVESQPGAQAPSASGIATPHPDRSARMVQAARDVDSSQRELDLAGADCQNACRALGSMDRATGHLCALAESNDEVRRCSDARGRLYSARDKVRSSCGSCPYVSVERSAPIPSR